MIRPRVAMVMAAGLGTRMRPLTDDRSKAMVEVAGRPLIDHVLDRLAAAGVERAVVNVHAFADDLETHLMRRSDLEVVISDERDALLETGGGLKAARPMLGDQPIFIANIDSLWTEDRDSPLERLAERWDPARMDDLLLLAPLDRSLGFSGAGDFFRAQNGALTHRGGEPAAPYAQAGVHLIDPRLSDSWPQGRYSIFPYWMAMQARGRLYGEVLQGTWMHVGDPPSRDAAEAFLAAGG